MIAHVLVLSAVLNAAGVARAAGYVDDGAHMLKPATISAIDARDIQLQARTGKAVSVVTVKSTSGVPVQDAANAAARARERNGALIYVVSGTKEVAIAYGTLAALFPPALQASIKSGLRTALNRGDGDNGVIVAADAISGIVAGGASGAHGPQLPAPVPQAAAPTGFLGFGWLWWVLILAVAIFIVFGTLRRPSTAGGAGGDARSRG